MFVVGTLAIMFFVISICLGIFPFFISKKSIKNREKHSPFECGFDSLKKKFMSFSVRFFSISLMFLIFDVEIVLILPVVGNFFPVSSPLIFMSFLSLIFVLFLGTLQEWSTSAFLWK